MKTCCFLDQSCVVWSKNTKLCAFDTRTGSKLFDLPTESSYKHVVAGGAKTYIAAMRTERIDVYNVPNRIKIFEVPEPTGTGWSTCCIVNHTLYAGAWNGNIYIVRLNAESPVVEKVYPRVMEDRTVEGLTLLNFSFQTSMLIVTNSCGLIVALDAENFRLKASWQLPIQISALASMWSSSVFAVGMIDGSSMLLDLKDTAYKSMFSAASSSRNSKVRSLRFSQDRKSLSVGRDDCLLIFRIPTAAVERSLSVHDAVSLLWSPEGLSYGTNNGIVGLYNFKKDATVYQTRLTENGSLTIVKKLDNDDSLVVCGECHKTFIVNGEFIAALNSVLKCTYCGDSSQPLEMSKMT